MSKEQYNCKVCDRPISPLRVEALLMFGVLPNTCIDHAEKMAVPQIKEDEPSKGSTSEMHYFGKGSR